ncbi:MAG: PilW family protein [Pseudomonadota bacterium]|nr:PilW family protein [Pseudomonadota bacterium]
MGTRAESLLAVVVGLVLLAGVGQWFLGRSQGDLGENSLRAPGRLAIDLLGSAIRAAGGGSCGGTPAFAPPIVGIDGDTGNYPAAIAPTVRSGTDAVVLLHCRPPPVYIIFFVGERAGLYRQPLAGDVGEMLVEEVEDLQLLYGQDNDGDGLAENYRPAGHPALDLERVISVRVSLRARAWGGPQAFSATFALVEELPLPSGP